MDYKQPDFYHFSEDSLELSRIAINRSKTDVKKILDIGCGCGVLAIECANNLASIESIHLIEPQHEFIRYIEHNLTIMLERAIHSKIFPCSFSGFKSDDQYDLIICNPPYFEKGTGRISQSMNKQICRTFELDSPLLYIQGILELLQDGGKAFILVPNKVDQWETVLKNYDKNFQMIKKMSKASIFLLC